MKKLFRVADQYLRSKARRRSTAANLKQEIRIVVEQTAEDKYSAQIPAKITQDLENRGELRQFLLARGLDQNQLQQLLTALDESGKAEIVVDPSAASLA